MAKRNVTPFPDLRNLITQALQSAISYDQDLIDCGGYMDKSEEKIAVRKVRRLRELLALTAPGRKTNNEELNEFLGELIDLGHAKMMTLQELKLARKNRKPS